MEPKFTDKSQNGATTKNQVTQDERDVLVRGRNFLGQPGKRESRDQVSGAFLVAPDLLQGQCSRSVPERFPGGLRTRGRRRFHRSLGAVLGRRLWRLRKGFRTLATGRLSGRLLVGR